MTAAPASAPPRFSVSIHPFAAATATSADEQFAEALTHDPTMAVGLGHRIPVASHSLAVTHKRKAIDPRATSRGLNVRHLVQGEVRRTGDHS